MRAFRILRTPWAHTPVKPLCPVVGRNHSYLGLIANFIATRFPVRSSCRCHIDICTGRRAVPREYRICRGDAFKNYIRCYIRKYIVGIHRARDTNGIERRNNGRSTCMCGYVRWCTKSVWACSGLCVVSGCILSFYLFKHNKQVECDDGGEGQQRDKADIKQVL